LPRAKAAAHIVAKIVDSGRDIDGKIVGGKKPSMEFPLRSLSKVPCTPKKGVLRRDREKEERTLAVSTVNTFAQTLRMVALSNVMDEYLPAKLKHPEKFLP